MVSVSSMLLGVALSAASASATSASASAYDALPAFAIPSFDYPAIAQGATPERLLHELQTNGIVALRNVPNYAHTRQLYLQKAAECAMAGAHDPEADFVSQKQFADGTKRYTISTTAGSELAASAANTETTCPGFRQLYQEFSQLVEHAVNTFGSTLDATSFTASDGARPISSRKLVSEAIRLDHFHAYEAASAVKDEAEHRELSYSLPLHEDHGLFIAMSAPKFFEVQQASSSDRKLVERQLAADKSGLVIQTSAGQRVRPVLNEDEVVIMMGSGASRWLQTSHQLPAVLHGMKMLELESVSENSRMLRTWFGKMTLLPAYQRMLENQDVVFDSVVNSTTRFLLQKSDDAELKTIGCAGDRQLTASDGSCTFRTCTTKSGATAPSEGCATICNRVGHSDTDASDCSSKCTCADASGTAEICWMLCVPNLPLDSCAKASQTCTGQEITCTSPITAPAPTTGTPSTSSPPATTPKPATSAPVTSAPAATSTPAAATPSTPSNAASGSSTTAPASATPGSSTTTSATPSPASASSTSGSTSSASSTTSSPSSATVTTPAPTTAATPSSAAADSVFSSAALLVTSVAALAHTLFQ